MKVTRSSLNDKGTWAAELVGVTKYYPGPPAVTALRDVSLRIETKMHTVVTGPSGCGKSTLVNLIGALDTVSAGNLFVAGIDLSTIDERGLARFRRETLGFVFQSAHLLPSRSVVENVELALVTAAGSKRRGHREVARDALETVGLGHRWDADPRHLSGGESQRVAIARAIAKSPKILIMDEPTGSLDSRNTDRVLELVRDVVATNITVLTVTHDPRVRNAGDRVVEMQDGRPLVSEATGGP